MTDAPTTSRRGGPTAKPFPASWSAPDVAVDFLTRLRPDGPWTVLALYAGDAPRVGNDSGDFPTRTFTETEPLRSWITRRIGKANLYYSPNRPAGRPAKKPSKADLSAGHVVHVDIDEVGGVHLALDSKLKAATAAKLLACEEPGPPSFVIDSGGGLQAIWVLSDAMKPSDFATLEGFNRHLAEAFDGDAGTHNVDRVLRLPGTINLPDAKKRSKGRAPAATRLLDATGRTYDPAWEFTAAAPSSTMAERYLDFGDPEPVADLDVLAEEHGLSESLLSIITDGRLQKPKDGDDSRSAWLFDATCQLVRKGVPNETILGILTDEQWAISASIFENPRGADDYAARTLRRAHEAIRAETLADFADDEIDRDEPASPEADQIKGLSITLASTVEQRSISWLWPNRIARGKLTGIAGEPDQGKSQVTTFVAATVSTGGDWPENEGAASVGEVLVLSAEDDAADTIVPRLAAADADLTRVHLMNMMVRTKAGRRMFSLKDDLPRLRAVLAEHPDIQLVIIDPVSAYMGVGEVDTFKGSDVRGVLAPLGELAEKTGAAVLFVTHFNKKGNGSALNRVTDSLAFTALARSFWAVIPERDGDKLTGRKLLVRIKQNIAAPTSGLAYHIEGVPLANGISTSRVVWDGKVDLTADEALAAQPDADMSIKVGEAVAFLAKALKDGPVESTELRERAEAIGINDRTLRRAKERLEVHSFQTVGRWWCELQDTREETDDADGY